MRLGAHCVCVCTYTCVGEGSFGRLQCIRLSSHKLFVPVSTRHPQPPHQFSREREGEREREREKERERERKRGREREKDRAREIPHTHTYKCVCAMSKVHA